MFDLTLTKRNSKTYPSVPLTKVLFLAVVKHVTGSIAHAYVLMFHVQTIVRIAIHVHCTDTVNEGSEVKERC